MATKRRRDDTLLPWFLAIEALASNEIDTSLLIDLVKKIPGDLSENEGKNVRELVCLRILESLSLVEKGKVSDALPVPDSSARIRPSDCCEDVLRQLLLKSVREIQESKGDIEQFVLNKRSRLPKCGLEQLKDVILKDSDSIPLSVKEKSGLLNKNHSDGNATRAERSDCDAFENPPVTDLSSGKENVSDSAKANQVGSSACNQLIKYKEYPDNAALKRKQDTFFAQKAVEGKDSASLNGKLHVDNVPGGIVQHSDREESDLLKEPQVENLREKITSEKVDSDEIALKKLKLSSTVGDSEVLHSQLQGTCNVENMTKGTSGEERGLNISADEANKDGEGCGELRTIGSSQRVVNKGTKSVDGAKENCEHSVSLTPNSVRCNEVNTTMEHDYQPETFSDEENDEILTRNNTFLNSQYSHSQDSLATLNGTKQLCMVCKLGGQLLVCSSESCRRMVHERCMGVAPAFDATRNFYCPFCAYSHAITEYSESKRKYSLGRKALAAFINRDEYRMRNSSNVTRRENQNHLRESEILNKCVEQNRLENVLNREIKNSSRINTRDKASMSCDSSSRDRARAVTFGENEVALEVERNAERGSSSVSCQSPSEQEQQVPVLGVQNGEAVSSLHGGNEQLAAVEKLQEVSHQPKGVPHGENKEDQYVTSQAVQDNEVNSKSKDLRFTRRRKQHAGTQKEEDVSNQPPVSPCKPAKATHSDVAKSSEEKNKSINQPFLRVRKREQHFTYPSMPQLRRQKIPWSNAEEGALKEGVKRFASNNVGLMPWKMILEFGADIFENRTAIDLKDKWRNICKASPKEPKV